MVGRRQLREKLLKDLYAFDKNPQQTGVVLKNTIKSLEKIYHLYVFQLNLIIALKNEAEEKIEIAKKKNFATEEDLNPNLKFVNNIVFKMLEENQELAKFTENHQDLKWNVYNQYPLAILKSLKTASFHQEYMKGRTNDFAEDKKYVVKIFDRYIAKNESLIDWFEEYDISWADDFHIANSMTLKTLRFIEEERPFNSLIQVFKGYEDKEFLQKLFKTIIENQEELNAVIKRKLINWELSRIAEMDKCILQMALAELIYFPEIPQRVVINEYIELAKTFSLPSSNVFINGILDSYIKETQH